MGSSPTFGRHLGPLMICKAGVMWRVPGVPGDQGILWHPMGSPGGGGGAFDRSSEEEGTYAYAYVIKI